MKIQIVGGTLLNTNNYIVGNSSDVILIEASAMPRDVKSIVGERKVKAIFLTHGHWDHSQFIDQFADEFNAKVYASEQAFEKIKSKEKQFNLDKPVGSQLKDEQKVILKDGEILDFGFLKIEVLETKGHTNCGVSLLISDENDKALFTGDTLFFETCGRYDLPTSSKEEMKESLKKLLALDEKLDVYPGHGYKTTIAHERETFKDILH